MRPRATAGRLFPSHGTLYAAPLVDPEMHAEQRAHADFWRALDGMYGLYAIL